MIYIYQNTSSKNYCMKRVDKIIIILLISPLVPSQISRISLTKPTGYETPALRVNWTSPQSEVAILQYWVQYRKSADTHWKTHIILPPATSADITGLDAGTAYSVRVRAVSDVGAGNWSEEQTESTYNCE